MDLCDDVDTHLARTIPRICATYTFDAQIHGNVRRCGAGYSDHSMYYGGCVFLSSHSDHSMYYGVVYFCLVIVIILCTTGLCISV